MLVAEGMGQHIDKGYIYFAMAFAVIVEMLNLRLARSQPPGQAARAAAGRRGEEDDRPLTSAAAPPRPRLLRRAMRKLSRASHAPREAQAEQGMSFQHI